MSIQQNSTFEVTFLRSQDSVLVETVLINYQGSNPETPLFVDVGGGVGIQCVDLKKRLPSSVQGRIVVQDQPPVVAQAIQMDGVEAMSYDFWEAQPIKGWSSAVSIYGHKAISVTRTSFKCCICSSGG